MNGTDKNGISIPDGWALYYDGELVFSTSKPETIGPGVEKIMELQNKRIADVITEAGFDYDFRQVPLDEIKGRIEEES